MNLEVIANKFAFLFDSVQDFEPALYDHSPSITLIPNKADAFMLNPISAGWVKTIVPKVTVNTDAYNGMMVRAVIGYAQMARLESASFGMGCLILGTLINNMMIAAKENGCPPFSSIYTFERPTVPRQYFRELENNAGYELRLYVRFDGQSKTQGTK